MSAVQIAVLGDPAIRVPVTSFPFWIGRDPTCHLCVWDLRVSRRHARIAFVRGEYVLSSEGRHGVFLRGERVPVLSLRHGDEIDLTPPDGPERIRLRFENDLADVFVPPENSVWNAWMDRERSRGLADRTVLGGFVSRATVPFPDGVGGIVEGRDRASGRPVSIKVYPVVASGEIGEAHLRLVAALAGASHPSLVRVLEGGVVPVPNGYQRWIACTPVAGRVASSRIAEGSQSALTVVRRLRSMADALHLLHTRSVVHGGIVPANVLLRPDGGAMLLGFGRATLREDARPLTPFDPADAPYVAPEVRGPEPLGSPAADLYGLAAVGYGLLHGRAPAAPDEHATPGGGAAPRDAGGAPAPLEEALHRGLSTDPAARPTAEEFGRALAFADVAIASGPR